MLYMCNEYKPLWEVRPLTASTHYVPGVLIIQMGV